MLRHVAPGITTAVAIVFGVLLLIVLRFRPAGLLGEFVPESDEGRTSFRLTSSS